MEPPGTRAGIGQVEVPPPGAITVARTAGAVGVEGETEQVLLNPVMIE
jgi:hypothetical protein